MLSENISYSPPGTWSGCDDIRAAASLAAALLSMAPGSRRGCNSSSQLVPVRNYDKSRGSHAPNPPDRHRVWLQHARGPRSRHPAAAVVVPELIRVRAAPGGILELA